MPRLVELPWCVLAAVLIFPAARDGRAEQPLQYNRDVRPILADKCFQCHGPDSAAREADLRLDQRDAAVDAAAIVPGEPDESEVIARVESDDPDLVMPPAALHKALTEAEKATLRTWIAQGAEYQPHWSFIPPQRPPLPQVDQQQWVRNPIDTFVLARLEAENLSPAPETDRATWARRVSLDLTGLPPAPDLVEQFAQDNSPDAYEKLVDRLLASPSWGEHRARYWLDYARYADTHGIHFDNYREMWSYRDWIIQAFNANMPFDQFTIENLAGDLLPNATLDQQIGSGFNRCNMTTNEGGIIDEEYLVLYARDRTETTAGVWMGLTANCAVCHDHKFDPLTQREFYELAAFFNNTTQGARDGNVHNTPPIVPVPRADDRPRWNQLEQELPTARARSAERRELASGDFDRWLATAGPESIMNQVPAEGLHLHAPLQEGSGQESTVLLESTSRAVPLTGATTWTKASGANSALQIVESGVLELADAGDFSASTAFSCGAWIKLPAQDTSGAIVARMDDQHDYRGWDLWVEQRRIGSHLIHRWSDDALKVVATQQVPADTWTHVLVTYDGSRAAGGIHIYYDGKPQEKSTAADSLEQDIHTDVPLKIGQRNTAQTLVGLALHDVRIYRRALTPLEAQSVAHAARLAGYLAQPAADRGEAARSELFDWYLRTLDPQYPDLLADVQRLANEQETLRARGTIAHVMQERPEPAKAHVLFRGEYDQRRDEVTPDTPDVLPPFPEGLPRNRLGLAQWLMLPEHPLTARVTVNRFWQEVFGTGLVKTTGDFGVSGELPEHAQLLDWLAVDFRESGWDVQRLFRQIVLSATYRQAAVTTPEKRERDPDNRLLSRGPRFRMEAEMVRDYALAASGLLVSKIGGPSVKPYQPPGVWEAIAMNVSNTRSYQVDQGENLYRRSMYTFWKRMAPPASMEIFNAPTREFCVVRRDRTNTPLQALVTLNDPQFVEAARHLAQRALTEFEGDQQQRFDWLGRQLIARRWHAHELPILTQVLAGLRDHYTTHPDDVASLLAVGESSAAPALDPCELAAWTMLVNAVMNKDEVLCK